MIWSEEEVALLAKEIPSLYLDRADDAGCIADAVIESRWMLAHDAEIRNAVQAEAWDEGASAAYLHVDNRSGQWIDPPQNPYRTATDEETR